MPIFCDLQLPDSSWRYVADDHVPATDPQALGRTYVAGLVDLDEVRIAQQYVHGGLVQADYGRLVLAPDALATWPPPATMDCWVRYLAPGATPAVSPESDVLVMAKAVLAEWDGAAIIYDLTQPAPTDTIADTLISGTLAAVCDSVGYDMYFPGTVSGTGVLSYAGRTPSPAVYYRVEGEQLKLPLLGDICAFFTHRIVISPIGGATVTDVTQQIGTSLALTTADVRSITYMGGERYRWYQAKYVQPYIRNIELRIRQTTAAGSYCTIGGAKVTRSVGGPKVAPAVAARVINAVNGTPLGDPTRPGFPLTNLTDSDLNTIWATTSDSTVLPFSGAKMLCLALALSTGTIAEYALASGAGTEYNQAPTEWSVYGWDVSRLTYRLLGKQVSDAWGALEERTYAVPAEVDWPVQVAGDYGAATIWQAPLVGNQASYSTINTALGLIKTINAQPRVRVVLPLALQSRVHIGQRITITDDTTPTPTSSYLLVASLTYNFADEILVAEGPGGLL